MTSNDCSCTQGRNWQDVPEITRAINGGVEKVRECPRCQRNWGSIWMSYAAAALHTAQTEAPKWLRAMAEAVASGDAAASRSVIELVEVAYGHDAARALDTFVELVFQAETGAQRNQIPNN